MKVDLTKYKTEEKYRARIASLAAYLNKIGLSLIVRSRKLVHFLNAEMTDAEAERFIVNLPALHRKIQEILAAQRRDYSHLKYFYGQPYQGLALLGIFGERPTEERFDTYGLADLIGKDDTVLDIGCNCGFVGLIAAYRTGCRVVGVDINPHMVEIGRVCADYLRLSDRVRLEAARIQDYKSDQPVSAVFSFATHWTDDGNYRVTIDEHMQRIHGMLKPGGLLVFESHCADVVNPVFHEKMESIRSLFDHDGGRKIENGTRLVYIMRRK